MRGSSSALVALGFLIAACAGLPNHTAEPFARLESLDVGKAPHQITFSRDGSTAVVAVAGSNRVVAIDANSFRTVGTSDVGLAPLGVAITAEDPFELVATQFGSDTVQRVSLHDPASAIGRAKLTVGEGPSFLIPLPGERCLASIERADHLQVLDLSRWTVEATYPTGHRPFPPATTLDGRKAFVPNYDDGTVTVVDLWNGEIRATTRVGTQPSGGVVLPGDLDYAVAVRGEDKIAFVNVGSHDVDDELGVGTSPFSVVASHDGRYAFVNNTGSHDVSVIELATRTVVHSIPTGEIPIALAVRPDDSTLWVACEGSHRVQVFAVPPRAESSPRATGPAQVAVLGMIHGAHRTSERFGLDVVRRTIESFEPDVLCVELPPNRWKRVARDYREHEVVEDSRAKVFPEYVDVVLPMTKTRPELIIEPCAAWTVEMNELRKRRMRGFETEPRFAAKRDAYRAASAAAKAQSEAITDTDDPRRIHTEEYDAAMAASLEPYDRFLNDHIGPGGWTHINASHCDLIEAAIRRHPGKRILITFGAGHKLPILERLRTMPEVEIVEISPFLP